MLLSLPPLSMAGGIVLHPRDICALIPGTKNMSLYGKGDLADVVKVMDLEMRDNVSLIRVGGPNQFP